MLIYLLIIHLSFFSWCEQFTTMLKVFHNTGVQDEKCKMKKMKDSVVSLGHCPFCVLVNNLYCMLQFINPSSLVF